jgi:hypothetical protein
MTVMNNPIDVDPDNPVDCDLCYYGEAVAVESYAGDDFTVCNSCGERLATSPPLERTGAAVAAIAAAASLVGSANDMLDIALEELPDADPNEDRALFLVRERVAGLAREVNGLRQLVYELAEVAALDVVAHAPAPVAPWKLSAVLFREAADVPSFPQEALRNTLLELGVWVESEEFGRQWVTR